MPHTSSPRLLAAQALVPAVRQFPDLARVDLALDAAPAAALDPRDRALALAIHRTVLQRWITLEYLLDRRLRQPFADLEPALAAVLLTAAAQLLFMDRLPKHAVVHESVEVARQLVRPGAAGLANAVLRRIADDVLATHHDQPWQLGDDRLPVEQGCVQVAPGTLPPAGRFHEHLAVATSMPRAILADWEKAFGRDRTIDLAAHAVRLPPTIVAVEPDFPDQQPDCLPHEQTGFVIWQGDRARLRDMLAQHPARRVQDPASAVPVTATANLNIAAAIDFCAGRGTKTRQLATTHPQATIFATDVDGRRFADLQNAFPHQQTEQQGGARPSNVRIVPMDQLAPARGRGAVPPVDLLLLDVPCSNTAVLARRPEARYRLSDAAIAELVELQRTIAQRALTLLKPGGYMLYSSCSLDERENQQQAAHLVSLTRGRLLAEKLILPGGSGTTYHDGSFHALIQTPPQP